VKVELFALTVLMAVLGSFANVLMWIKSWDELTSFEASRTVLTGLVVGVLWYFMRVEHGVPDSVVTFVVGYTAKDVIESVVERFKPAE
jgi:uncharacterized membrane protein YoaK (UPF0700 family)